ncbi:unnamed protein product [Ixodes hexagonus]
MELEYSLKSHLKTLGINKIFDADADLSGITSDEGLVVSDVVHRAVVEVNEEGTEAAAASGVVVVNRLIEEPTLEFKVDHPFMFFIRNTQTKDLIFAGQLIQSYVGSAPSVPGVVMAICDPKLEPLTVVNNRFGLRLLKILPSPPHENVFFSPYSVSIAMGMTFMGAMRETRQELSQGMGYSAAGLRDSDVLGAYTLQTNRLRALQSNSTLDLFNAAAIDKSLGLLGTYEAQLKGAFNAELIEVDFQNEGQAAVDVINQWVNRKSGQTIQSLFDAPLDPDTVLVLLNAIYFKGFWDKQFKKEHTGKETFLNGGTTPVELDTMSGTMPVRHFSFKNLGVDVAELPYKDGDYTMLILLPEKQDGVEALKQNLTEGLLEDIERQLENRGVLVFLPKFKLETQYQLKDYLESLGIRRMFDRRADLSGIAGAKDLRVAAVIHKAVVEVNEEGTEAASVTAVRIVKKSASVPKHTFEVDHPFLFFIRNSRTKEILFAGQVNHL